MAILNGLMLMCVDCSFVYACCDSGQVVVARCDTFFLFTSASMSMVLKRVSFVYASRIFYKEGQRGVLYKNDKPSRLARTKDLSGGLSDEVLQRFCQVRLIAIASFVNDGQDGGALLQEFHRQMGSFNLTTAVLRQPRRAHETSCHPPHRYDPCVPSQLHP